MRLVTHAATEPHRCAAIPFIGNSNAKAGFVDTGQILHGWDPYVYISTEAVEEMARMIGWEPGHVRDVDKFRIENLRAQLAEKDAEIDMLRERIDAVRVLKNTGDNGVFTQANPPGRPPKKVAANAA